MADMIQFPVAYHAADPVKTSFVPLGYHWKMNLREILTDHPKGMEFGWIVDQFKQFPFLKDAKDQCAPYALFLLARARRDVVQGTITVPGNEYYQLGDVIYINSRDMLFYVWSIKHNFSYDGGQFTTTLECRYGHTLGEYIPTPLDVIGKQMIREQEKFNRVLITRETAADQTHGQT